MGHSFPISDSAHAFPAAADISIMGIKGHRQTDGGGDKLNANPIIPVVIRAVLTICLPVSFYAHIGTSEYVTMAFFVDSCGVRDVRRRGDVSSVHDMEI